MMFTASACLLYAFVQMSAAFSPEDIWFAGIEGQGATANILTTDNRNNLIFVGSAFGSSATVFSRDRMVSKNVSFDRLLSDSNAANFVVVKYSPTGDIQWTVQSSTRSRQVVSGVTTDVAGNIYCSGQYDPLSTSSNGFRLIDSEGVSTTITIGSTIAPFLFKLTPDGKFVWVRVFRKAEMSFKDQVAYLPNGLIVFLLPTVSSKIEIVNGQSKMISSVSAKSDYSYNAFLVAFTSDGKIQWSSVLTSVLVEKRMFINTAFERGTILIFGSFDTPSSFTSFYSIKNQDVQLSGGLDVSETRSFVASIDENGRIGWHKVFQGIEPGSVVADSLGNVVIGGYSTDRTISLSDGITINNSNQTILAVLTKLLADGSQFLWHSILAGPSQILIEDLTMSLDGSIFSTGFYNGDVAFVTSSSCSEKLDFPSGSDRGFYLAKFSENGCPQWSAKSSRSLKLLSDMDNALVVMAMQRFGHLILDDGAKNLINDTNRFPTGLLVKMGNKNGTWSDWASFSACDAKCPDTIGYQERKRSCLSVSLPCFGPDTDIQSCSITCEKAATIVERKNAVTQVVEDVAEGQSSLEVGVLVAGITAGLVFIGGLVAFLFRKKMHLNKPNKYNVQGSYWSMYSLKKL